jgi:hypothetical protein
MPSPAMRRAWLASAKGAIDILVVGVRATRQAELSLAPEQSPAAGLNPVRAGVAGEKAKAPAARASRAKQTAKDFMVETCQVRRKRPIHFSYYACPKGRRKRPSSDGSFGSWFLGISRNLPRVECVWRCSVHCVTLAVRATKSVSHRGLGCSFSEAWSSLSDHLLAGTLRTIISSPSFREQHVSVIARGYRQ